MSRRIGLVLVMALLSVGLLTVPYVAKSMRVASAEPALPVLSDLSAFTLTNAAGAAYNSATLAGKIWVADFFFTSCTGTCPVMSTNMAKLQTQYAERDDVNFVSISVNPEVDTPERLTTYADKYKANLNRWHFLTGPDEQIQSIAVDEFKLGLGDSYVLHSTRFVLVDRQGRIRGYYSGVEEEEVEEIARDIERLLREGA
jgi:protein SCO1/2